ncbi:hypothetical protein [Flammeovirga sp. SubArs3]|uniref:hypothetical protein n=1 Tax=Flammeovirga sp. SubArs3 TaxID=2995316 RepID=UPI00248B361B|nr:hypothetical protein [Flammeovirga sp. SubArs3]
MSGLHYKTWIGEHFSQKRIFNKKILILGESHYADGAEDKTELLIKETMSGRFKHPFYTKLVLSFLEEENAAQLSLDRKVFFWQSVAYNNFVQDYLDQSRQAPSHEMWERGRNAFYELLEQVKPDIVFVCGYRLWDQLPHKFRVESEKIGSLFTITYQYKDISAQCVRSKHPSANYSPAAVYSNLESFLGKTI